MDVVLEGVAAEVSVESVASVLDSSIRRAKSGTATSLSTQFVASIDAGQMIPVMVVRHRSANNLYELIGPEPVLVALDEIRDRAAPYRGDAQLLVGTLSEPTSAQVHQVRTVLNGETTPSERLLESWCRQHPAFDERLVRKPTIARRSDKIATWKTFSTALGESWSDIEPHQFDNTTNFVSEFWEQLSTVRPWLRAGATAKLRTLREAGDITTTATGLVIIFAIARAQYDNAIERRTAIELLTPHADFDELVKQNRAANKLVRERRTLERCVDDKLMELGMSRGLTPTSADYSNGHIDVDLAATPRVDVAWLAEHHKHLAGDLFIGASQLHLLLGTTIPRTDMQPQHSPITHARGRAATASAKNFATQVATYSHLR